MAELFKIAIDDVRNATERAFYKVLAEKGLTYEKLSLLVGKDDQQEMMITDRAIKAYAVEGNTPPITKAILLANALDDFKEGLGATFLNEILKIIGYKVIPLGQSNDNKLLEHIETVIEAHKQGIFEKNKEGL